MIDAEPSPSNPELPDPRSHPPVVRPAQPGDNTLAIGMTLLVALSGGIWVLLSAGTRTTSGARVSTRLRWERREAELDRLIEKARAEGKLPPAPADAPRPDERR